MDYVLCKLMTKSFQEKFEKILQREAEEKVMKEHNFTTVQQIIDNNKTLSIDIAKMRSRDSWFYMWNNPSNESYHKLLDGKNSKGEPMKLSIADYYKSLGLWEPETTSQIFEIKNQGLQSMIRIEWNGEIQKIDEIDEILSYTLKVPTEMIQAFCRSNRDNSNTSQITK